MEVIQVSFVDPTTYSCGWTSLEEAKSLGLRVCKAAGFVVAQGDDTITVALLLSDDEEEVSNWIVIPRDNIISRSVLSKKTAWEAKPTKILTQMLPKESKTLLDSATKATEGWPDYANS